MSISAAQQKILLSQAGLSFTAVAQAWPPLPRNFGILNQGQGSLNWTASTSTLSGGPWLSLDVNSGTVARPLLDVSLVNVNIDPSGLGPGDYRNVTMGGREVLGQALDFSAPPPPFHLTMKQARATVRGKAELGTVSVILVPAQSEKVTVGRQALPREDGSFEITGVAPGSYFIAAFSGLRPSLDPAILTKVWTLGTRVNV
jgi:hypothetical protein